MKKWLFLLSFLFLASPLYARTCTWDGDAAPGDPLASNAANWDTDTVCVATDDVVFDGTSADNCTFDLTADFASLNTTGYSGVITASATTRVSGNVTLANGTWAHGNQKFIADATGTYNFGNNEMYAFDFNASATYTFASDLITNSTLTFVTGNIVITGNFKIYAKGDVIGSASYVFDNPAGMVLEFSGGGSQTWNQTNSAFRLIIPVIINKSGGTLTFGTTNPIKFEGDYLTHTAGTVSATGNTFEFQFSGTVLDAAGINFANVLFSAGTLTHNAEMHILGNVDHDTQVIHNGTGNKIYVGGNLQKSVSAGYVYNQHTNTQFELNGTGAQTWEDTVEGTGWLIDVIVNKYPTRSFS